MNHNQYDKKPDKLDVNASDGGYQKVTLVTNVAQATAQECRYCRIQCRSINTAIVRMRIGEACTSDSGLEIAGNPVLTPYAIDNLNLLYFWSSQSDAIIDIEFFN